MRIGQFYQTLFYRGLVSTKVFTERGFDCFPIFNPCRVHWGEAEEYQTNFEAELNRSNYQVVPGHNQSQCLGRQVAPTREQQSPGRDLDRGLHQVNS